MVRYAGVRLTCSLLVLSAACAYSADQQTNTLHSDGLRAAAPNVPTASAIANRPLLTPEMRGDIFMARKMYREAIDKYREMPESAMVDNKIGIAFHQMLEFSLARKNYERAIKLDPHYADAINNLGTVYYAGKSYRRAIGYYRRALRASGPSASVYANLGAAYFARKDYKRASGFYEEALKLDPEVFEHHSGFGTLMQERTVTELALFHLALAKTYAKAGSNERALLYLRKALEEGVKDRNKIPDIPEFGLLKKDPAFGELLALNPKPL